MKALRVIMVLGCMYFVTPATSQAEEIDLTGLWQSKTGSVSSISQNGEKFQGNIVRFGSPETSKKYGFEIGDTVLVGGVTGGSIRMSLNKHYPVRYRSICPDQWSQWVELNNLNISPDGARISGWWQVYRINEDCRLIQAERHQTVMVRWPALSTVEIVAPGDLKPIDEIAIGQSFRVRLTFAEDPGTEITETVTIGTSDGSAQKVRVTGNSRVIVSEPILVAPSGQ